MTFDDMMQRFAIVLLGGEAVVIEDMLPGAGRDNASFQYMTIRTFEALYRGQYHDYIVKKTNKDGNTVTEPKRVKLTTYWLDHPGKRVYQGFGYAMPGGQPLPPHYYDGWRGFTVQPKAGNWERNKRHIYEIICAGNDDNFDWVMNWLAAMFQKPGRHAGTAIVLRGKQGSGKGYFARDMIGGCFYKEQYLQVLGGNELTGEFNEHLSGKVLIFADEAIWGGNVQAANRLKGMITEPRITINRKFLKIESEPSALHIIAASNEDWAVHVDTGDRRFSVLDVSNAHRLDDEYFEDLYDEFKHGGRAAMLHELMQLEVDWKLLRRPLFSTAKIDLLKESWKGVDHWWDTRLLSGHITERIDEWPSKIAMRDLHDDYMQFQDRYHKNSREKLMTPAELGKFFQRFKMPDDGNHSPVFTYPWVVRLEDGVARGMYFPDLDECRQRWLRTLHLPVSFTWKLYSDQVDESGKSYM